MSQYKGFRIIAWRLGTAGAVLATTAAGWSFAERSWANDPIPMRTESRVAALDGIELAAAGRPSYGSTRERILQTMRARSAAPTNRNPQPEPAAATDAPASSPAAVQAQTVSQPQPSPNSTQRPVPQVTNAGGKTEVERRLEELYRRDGREMPDLNFQAAPARQQAPTAPAPSPAPQAQREEESSNPVVRFFRKLIPGRSEEPAPRRAPVPQPTQQPEELANTPPKPLPAHGGQPLEIDAVDVPAPAPPITADTAPVPPEAADDEIEFGFEPIAETPRDAAEPAPEVAAPAARDAGLPEWAREDAPADVANTAPAESPATEQSPEAADEASEEPDVEIAADADFPDPFTEMSEAEADQQKENPFSGLKLEPRTAAAEPVEETPLEPVEEPAVADIDAEPAQTDESQETEDSVEVAETEAEDDFPRLEMSFEASTESVIEEAPDDAAANVAERDEKSEADPQPEAEIAQSSKLTTNEAAELKDEPQAEVAESGPRMMAPGFSDEAETAPEKEQSTDEAAPRIAESQPREVEEDPYAEELRRIRQRGEIPGFKGFCPVTLRERRELVDASPRYTSRHLGVTYTFASSAAKQAFDRNPSRYAPAAAGRDVVLLLDGQDDVEGSLDHAVWYRDQLYMFSSQASYETFVDSPAKYAAPRALP